jgi:hypothetical protein
MGKDGVDCSPVEEISGKSPADISPEDAPDLSPIAVLRAKALNVDMAKQLRDFVVEEFDKSRVENVLTHKKAFESEEILNEYLFLLVVLHWQLSPVRTRNDAVTDRSKFKKHYSCDVCFQPLFQTNTLNDGSSQLLWDKTTNKGKTQHICDTEMAYKHLLSLKEKAIKESCVDCKNGRSKRTDIDEDKVIKEKQEFHGILNTLLDKSGHNPRLVAEYLKSVGPMKRFTKFTFTARYAFAYAEAYSRQYLKKLDASPRQDMALLVEVVPCLIVYNSLLVSEDLIQKMNAAFDSTLDKSYIKSKLAPSIRGTLAKDSLWLLSRGINDRMVIAIMATLESTGIGQAIAYGEKNRFLMCTSNVPQEVQDSLIMAYKWVDDGVDFLNSSGPPEAFLPYWVKRMMSLMMMLNLTHH